MYRQWWFSDRNHMLCFLSGWVIKVMRQQSTHRPSHVHHFWLLIEFYFYLTPVKVSFFSFYVNNFDIFHQIWEGFIFSFLGSGAFLLLNPNSWPLLREIRHAVLQILFWQFWKSLDQFLVCSLSNFGRKTIVDNVCSVLSISGGCWHGFIMLPRKTDFVIFLVICFWIKWF